MDQQKALQYYNQAHGVRYEEEVCRANKPAQNSLSPGVSVVPPGLSSPHPSSMPLPFQKGGRVQKSKTATVSTNGRSSN